ncbi:MAG: lipid A biosynthesis acyltransferase [Burkholderiaceae bacterium]|nr:MAG: lipid A biosynthesis acyltransferase [Burkholderiaceae bacterium]
MRFGLGVLRGLGRLPLPVVRLLGILLGVLLFLVAGERRRVALTNLRLCFPARPTLQRIWLACRHVIAMTQSLLDRGWLWYAPPTVVARRVRWRDLQYYEAAAAQGPVILLAPHFVGLDAGGMRVGMSWHVVSMYSRQKNPVFDAAIVAGRSRFNAPVLLSRQDGVRGAVRALKQGLPFYYLPDMDFGARDAEFVPFFGVPAATVTAPSRLAKVTGARIVPCVSRMTWWGYEVRLYPAWDNYPSEDVVADTTRMNRFIEALVLEMPAQYLWTHKRFKTRPAGEAKPY